MPDLLIEVGCEELPSSACREIVEQAPALLGAALAAAGVPEGWSATVSVAPRRFAVQATGLPVELASTSRTVRGPAASAAFDADGAPTKAALGFARGQGIAVEDLVVREDGGREFVFAELHAEGRPMEQLVPEVAAHLIGGLRFSKTMRWGSGTGLRFSRPVRWIVAKLDDRTVPFELHGLTAGDVSQGHRFLGGPATIASAATYVSALEQVAVIPSHEARRTSILADLDAAAEAAGGTWADPGGKIEEVLFLVEWPSVITGGFDERHLRLPSRVLVTAMQGHQRYFPLRDDDGRAAAEVPRRLQRRSRPRGHHHARQRGRARRAAPGRRVQLRQGPRGRPRRARRPPRRDRVPQAPRARWPRSATAWWRGCSSWRTPSAPTPRPVRPPSTRRGWPRPTRARCWWPSSASSRATSPPSTPAARASPTRWPRPSSSTTCPRAPTRRCPPARPAHCWRPPSASTTWSARSRWTRPRPAPRTRTACAVPPSAWCASRSTAAGTWTRAPFWRRPTRASRPRAPTSSLPADATVDAIQAFLGDRFVYLLGEEGVGAEAAAAAIGARLGGLTTTAAWARAIQSARGGAPFVAVWTASTRLNRLARKGPDDEVPIAPGDDPGEAALRSAVEAAAVPIDAAHGRGDFDAALAAAEPLASAVDRFFVDVLVNADDPGVRARRYALVREAAGVLSQVADFERVTDVGGAR